MAYNENHAVSVRNILLEKNILFEEKKMFGGLAFMINGKMSCGLVKDELMIRIVESKYETALKNKDARKMDFTGKPLKGFLYVSKNVFSDDEYLSNWIDLGIEYVMSLKALKKKK